MTDLTVKKTTEVEVTQRVELSEGDIEAIIQKHLADNIGAEWVNCDVTFSASHGMFTGCMAVLKTGVTTYD